MKYGNSVKKEHLHTRRTAKSAQRCDLLVLPVLNCIEDAACGISMLQGIFIQAG
jgi:hypothetical protein